MNVYKVTICEFSVETDWFEIAPSILIALERAQQKLKGVKWAGWTIVAVALVGTTTPQQ